jgi:hypothetical protein
MHLGSGTNTWFAARRPLLGGLLCLSLNRIHVEKRNLGIATALTRGNYLREIMMVTRWWEKHECHEALTLR